MGLAGARTLGDHLTGVEALGHLWNLTLARSEDPCFSQMPRDVMKSPLKVEGTVHHKALASAQVQRWLTIPERSCKPASVGASSCCSQTCEVLSADGRAVDLGNRFNESWCALIAYLSSENQASISISLFYDLDTSWDIHSPKGWLEFKSNMLEYLSSASCPSSKLLVPQTLFLAIMYRADLLF